MSAINTYQKLIPSPVGPLLVTATNEGIVSLHFDGEPAQGSADNVHLDQLTTELEEYFAGERTEFDVAMVVEGTEFQKKAWKALCDIPYGETRSYGTQAKALGDPKACRAVGAANGQNPIAIVIPCHRVIGTSGKLTGFGGGLDKKRWLLDHERDVLAKRGLLATATA